MEGAEALCRLLEVGMRPCVRLIPVPELTPVPPKANLSHPEPGTLALFNVGLGYLGLTRRMQRD